MNTSLRNWKRKETNYSTLTTGLVPLSRPSSELNPESKSLHLDDEKNGLSASFELNSKSDIGLIKLLTGG